MDLILSEISLLSFISIIILVVVGSIVQTVGGFGFGIFVMILLPSFMPTYSSALALSSFLSSTIAASIAIKQLRRVQFKVVIIPILSYFLISTFAVELSIIGSDGILKGLLGVVLIILSIYFLKFASNISITATPTTGAISGGLSGFLSGMFGMGGPPMVLYLLASTQNTAAYLATSQFFFATTNGYNTLIRALNGSYTPFVLIMWVISLISLYIGNKIGNKLVSKVSDKTLRNIVYIFMGVSGVIITITEFIL